MPYSTRTLLDTNEGNNALSFAERAKLTGKTPSLSIPARIQGDIDDIIVGDHIVFEEVENGTLHSCCGLEHFVEIRRPHLPEIVVFDNHNHALFFWCEAIQKGMIQPGFELIHMDEHSDLWDNASTIANIAETADLHAMWQFTNYHCNVGNYIRPALDAGLVGNMIRLENEFQIDAAHDLMPNTNSVFNLDLDIFAPELAHIPEEKIISLITHLIQHVKYVTIATSPYFIDQRVALSKLRKILSLL